MGVRRLLFKARGAWRADTFADLALIPVHHGAECFIADTGAWVHYDEDEGWILNGLLATSSIGVSVGATTDEVTLATVAIPPRVLGRNGYMKVWSTWTCNNSGNNKVPRIRWDTPGITPLETPLLSQALTGTTLSLNHLALVQNQNSYAEQVLNFPSNAGLSGSTVTTLFNTTNSEVETELSFTGQKASADDTLILERYIVEVTHVP